MSLVIGRLRLILLNRPFSFRRNGRINICGMTDMDATFKSCQTEKAKLGGSFLEYSRCRWPIRAVGEYEDFWIGITAILFSE
jgi:hypothetical protein